MLIALHKRVEFSYSIKQLSEENIVTGIFYVKSDPETSACSWRFNVNLNLNCKPCSIHCIATKMYANKNHIGSIATAAHVYLHFAMKI